MPFVPQDVLDRLTALERQVRQLTGRAQMRPAMNQVLNGDTVIGEGGRLIVRDPDGTATFETGVSSSGDYYTTIRRDDGRNAVSVGANTYEGDDAVRQMVRLWSRAGDRIVMDDYYSDRFLGRPWMPLQLHPTNERGRYTGTNYAEAWSGWTPIHNAVAVVYCRTYSGDGGAQARLTLEHDGDVRTLDEWDCAPNQWTSREVNYPVDGLGFLDYAYVALSHRAKTAGQQVETRLLMALTRNTVNADETPTLPLSTSVQRQPEGGPDAA
ncbi:hypothetical protein [Streptomyces sp. NPDC091046]|uniref:hypothetical protein n=1 Tax=Streptomyces sp. NPDC091046 TaxID=3365973 RepID=UPI0038204639